MHPSPTPAAGPTAVKIKQLPPAGRDEMLGDAGLSGSGHWAGVRRWGHGPDDGPSDAPGSDTVQYKTPHERGTDEEEQETAVSRRALEERGFLIDGSWRVVSVKGGNQAGGVTSHRGVLRGDEYIDHEKLVALVERELGYTFDDVHAVYRKGRLTDTQRELRGQIDARLLALSLSGANMALLARVLGFVVAPNGNCKAVDRALARARGLEKAAA